MSEAKKFFADAGLVLLAWLLLLLTEALLVSAAYRGELVASWEVSAIVLYPGPIALAALVPAAFFVVAAARLARSRGGARILGIVVGAMAIALVFATESRALSSPAARYGAAAAAAAVAVIATRVTVARATAWTPRTHAIAGVALALVLALVNATVLVRLYAPFHAALLGLTLLAFASLARVLAASRFAGKLGLSGIAMGAFCILFTATAARRLVPYDNARLVLLEHAPTLGPAVRIAAHLAPPAPVESDAPEVNVTAAEVPRALDWENRDIVLLSVDALRADHVGAYGYARATTPNIDALATEGVVFEHAYCPTPHTSYSVTSMMTGKYMRPLLKMSGDQNAGPSPGEDSETFAAILRRYTYKTAAFYPPAVFFIDESKFTTFRDHGLDFEYRKVEFAEPQLREKQIRAYLERAKKDAPLFLWAHLFEPHEPYVFHDEHPFGKEGRPTDIDRYDSEIATADTLIGQIVALVRATRKNPVFIVTADHGEEFGDHGGHHHGTTVFEEQVRVPLVVVAQGVAPTRVDAPAQTIDILPTVLSALGIPRPARVRGRDLGPAISGREPAGGASGESAREGFAFAETDDFAMIARGSERLVCERKVSLCTLYDVKTDPGEKHDLSRERGADVDAAKRLLRNVELEHGRFEASARQKLPDALRRGLQGDVEAAVDVATLLDDASPEIRRLAAEVSFKLHAKDTAPSLRRALQKSEDADVRSFAALALVRMGEPTTPLAEDLLRGPDPTWRELAALAFAEHGDARGAADLARHFERARGDFEEAKVTLLAIARIKAKEATPALLAALSDVRLRPFVADALGAIGRSEARAPLLSLFSSERYPAARVAEARALVALGASADVYAGLRRFAGAPEPMLEAIAVAGDAHLLTPEHGALWPNAAMSMLEGDVTLSSEKNQRIVIASSDAAMSLDARIDGAPLTLTPRDGGLFIADFVHAGGGTRAHVKVSATSGAIRGAWIVPLADDVALPPKEAWDAGPEPAAEP